MAARATDHAVRDLWQLHEDAIFGRTEQVIWQPRIGCWFTDKQFEKEPLPEPYTGFDMPQIYRSLGVSNRLYEYNAAFVQVDDPAVQVRVESLDEMTFQAWLDTPVGQQTWITRRATTNIGTIWVKRPISTIDELRVATWRAEHATFRFDPDRFESVRQRWGRNGAPTIFMPRVNVQDLYINTMGVEAAIYAISDWQDAVEAYFVALDDLHLRFIDAIEESPVRIINFGDNLHGATLPPAYFLRWVMPAYHRRIERLHSFGCFVHSHWDGDTRPLLPLAQETGLDGIEAITPQPQGDVTLAEVEQALGGTMTLLDGIPALYFNDDWPVETLLECVDELLDRFAPRIILGISDELPSHGDIERIRLVTERVDDYNAGIAVRSGATPAS